MMIGFGTRHIKFQVLCDINNVTYALCHKGVTINLELCNCQHIFIIPFTADCPLSVITLPIRGSDNLDGIDSLGIVHGPCQIVFQNFWLLLEEKLTVQANISCQSCLETEFNSLYPLIIGPMLALSLRYWISQRINSSKSFISTIIYGYSGEGFPFTTNCDWYSIRKLLFKAYLHKRLEINHKITVKTIFSPFLLNFYQSVRRWNWRPWVSQGSSNSVKSQLK